MFDADNVALHAFIYDDVAMNRYALLHTNRAGGPAARTPSASNQHTGQDFSTAFSDQLRRAANDAVLFEQSLVSEVRGLTQESQAALQTESNSVKLFAQQILAEVEWGADAAGRWMMASSVNLSAGAVAMAGQTAGHSQSFVPHSFVDELSLFLYNHKNNPFAYAIIMHSGNVTQALKTATPYFAASADFSTELDPLTAVSKASAELMTHQNPVTGAYVSAKNAAILGGVGAAFGGMGKLAEFELALRGAREVGLFGGGGESQAALRSRVLGNIAETRAGINVTNFGVHAAVEKVPFLDISTHADEATFWSGKGNRQLAESFADLLVKRTIEMTSGGKYLESLNLFTKFSYEQARVPWERLSERFARNASGEVYAFVTGSTPGSVFRTVELPALIENPDVTN